MPVEPRGRQGPGWGSSLEVLLPSAGAQVWLARLQRGPLGIFLCFWLLLCLLRPWGPREGELRKSPGPRLLLRGATPRRLEWGTDHFSMSSRVSGKGWLRVSGRKREALPPRMAMVPKMTLGMKGCHSAVILTSGAIMLPMRVIRLLMPTPVCLRGFRAGIGYLHVGFLKDGAGAWAGCRRMPQSHLSLHPLAGPAPGPAPTG